MPCLREAGFWNTHCRYISEMYLEDYKSQGDYESFWAKRQALARRLEYWARGATHQTFFARAGR
jgi:hypothetical protein